MAIAVTRTGKDENASTTRFDPLAMEHAVSRTSPTPLAATNTIKPFTSQNQKKKAPAPGMNLGLSGPKGPNPDFSS